MTIMLNHLDSLLVVKTNDPIEEIKRLSKARGLDEPVPETDTHLFLERYFSKDSVKEQEVFYNVHNEKWAKCFASTTLQDAYVNPLDLDPFVARYIIAINRIGIKTYHSCDGWHKNSENKLLVGFKERYSEIWHKILFNLLRDNRGIIWGYGDHLAVLKLPNNDEGKIDTYLRLNAIAEYFEEHKNELLNLKEEMIRRTKGKEKTSLSNEELEQYLTDIVKGIITR